MADTDATFIPSLFTPSSLLPIAKYRAELLYTIEKFPVTIVIGQTGSGKTTQLPQYLEQAGWCADGKIIAVTQPRRVAATSVALRVAEEVGCPIGEEVGYSIRFEDVTSAKTRIKFLTDGLLLREVLVDPLLSRYSVIMVDEAHERSLSSDILLGVLKKILKRRPELRIIVSSATIQADEFLHFFATGNDTLTSSTTTKDQSSSTAQIGGEIGTIFYLAGRMYPVDIHNLTHPTEDYLERSLLTIFDIHTTEPPGDILVFLTGREEIDATVQLVADRALSLPPRSQTLVPLPLYAGLPPDHHRLIFEPGPENTRRVILATSIAEASLTIPSVVYVVDSGFVKQRAYNPTTGIATLTAVTISKASAAQRAGRAGRTKPGKCYRLYTAAAYAALPDATVPEIQRADLAPTILQLKALGVDNIARFDFLTPPPAELITRALELLYALGALDDHAKLTRPLGVRMADLGLDPMTAASLLSAPPSILSEMLSLAAMTSLSGDATTSSIWTYHSSDDSDDEGNGERRRKTQDSSRRAFAAQEGDHLTLLNVYTAFAAARRGRGDAAKWCRAHNLNFKTLTRASAIRNQLRRHLERFGIDVSSADENSTANSNPLPPTSSTTTTTPTTTTPPKQTQILRTLTRGLFPHAARQQPDGSFLTVDGNTTLHVHPSSLMFNRKAPGWVIFQEAVEGKGGKVFVAVVSCVEKAWLMEEGGGFYKGGSGGG